MVYAINTARTKTIKNSQNKSNASLLVPSVSAVRTRALIKNPNIIKAEKIRLAIIFSKYFSISFSS